MATKLYTRALSPASTHRGTNSAKADGSSSGWTARLLSPTIGTGATGLNGNTVAGPTSGVEMIDGTFPYEWISEPLAADVTISGTVTMNVWAFESSMSANVGMQVIVERLDTTGAVAATILNSERGVEVGTSATAQNWTAAPTSTAMLRGERIRVRWLANDIGTMGTGFQWFIDSDGSSGGADGDTWVQFTETLSFELDPVTDPATGTTTHDVAGSIQGPSQVTGFCAQSFTVPSTAYLHSVRLFFNNGGATGDLNWMLQTDASGVPSGVTLSAGQLGSLPLGTVEVQTNDEVQLVSGTTYWIVVGSNQTSGSLPGWFADTTQPYANGTGLTKPGGTWGTPQFGACDFAFEVTTRSGSRMFLLNDVSDLGSSKYAAAAAAGSSGAAKTTSTAAGWTAPIQVTDGGGGSAIEWYSGQLQAFTLGGKAMFTVWGNEDNSSALVSLRGEIAVCNADGSGAAVWGAGDAAPTLGSVTGPDGQISASLTTPFFIFVSGDDTAVASGKRLRYRLYLDDLSTQAMATGHTASVGVGGQPESGEETSVVLPQAVSAYVAFAGPFDSQQGNLSDPFSLQILGQQTLQRGAVR